MASKTLYVSIVVILIAIVAIGLLLAGGQQRQAPPTATTTTSPPAATTTQLTTQAQKVFKLGALLPLTGGFSSYAKLAQCAAELAVDDLNAKYGPGIKFELYVEDTQLDPNVALQNYKPSTQRA